MARGIGVAALRQYNITEGKVTLWSSVIFGAVHITNIIGGTGIAVAGQKAYVGSGAAILVYVIVGIVLLVRRHKIEPAMG